MKQTKTYVAVLLLMVGLLATPAVGATEAETTTVVAVGDSDDVLLTANAIANERGYDVLSVGDELSASDQQVLAQRSEHGTLSNVILVGHDLDPVAEQIDLPITRIEGAGYTAALQAWDSSDDLYLYTEADREEVNLALRAEGAPVLPASTNETDRESVLEYLGVETIYVSPRVSSDVRTDLSQNYTVQESVAGESLDQSVQNISQAYATGDAPVVAVDETHSLTMGSIDGDLIVGPTENADYGAGVENGTQLSHPRLQGHLLAANYTNGLIVSSVTSTEGELDVMMTNIGFNGIPVVDGQSLQASWTGTVLDSTPSGESVDGEYRVTNDERMEPGDEFEVELSVQQVENGGHPQLDYYLETAGGLISSDDSSLDLPFVDFSPPAWLIVAFAAGAALLALPALLRLNPNTSRRFRATLVSDPGWVNAVGVLIGAALIVYPEPITSATGVVLVGASLLQDNE